jgi:2-polyprenyl-3-methyl-5-hydroxy-6-metoxy-1,4-benzoquinol methylase
MPATTDAVSFFTRKHATYVRFIRLVRYPQGILTFFLKSSLLHDRLRVLDAGCGTGVITLALHEALARRGFALGTFHAFDVTPAMLERFRDALDRRGVSVETEQADVLDMNSLPGGWTDYDLIVTASMLEYVPRTRLADALGALRTRLAANGHAVVFFITRRNWLTRPLIGRWWQSNRYDQRELLEAFHRAGSSQIRFSSVPLAVSYLAAWGYVIGRTREQCC